MLSIKTDFMNDFEKAVLADITNCKNNGFLFEEYPEWKIKRISEITKEIERLKNLNQDISDTQKELEPNKLQDKYKEYLIYSYSNLRERIIPNRKRTIHYSSSFTRIPEYEKGLQLLESKINNGNELLPHMSRRIFISDDQDGLLFDFGIYHLHLGETMDRKYPTLIQGREKVLYCMFTDNDAYFLIIDKHGRWGDIDLLKIVKDNFPSLIDNWEMKNVVALTYYPTQEERVELRKNGINTPIVIDGKYYLSPGGGVNTIGTSGNGVLQMNNYYHHYSRLERNFNAFFDAHKNKIIEDTKLDGEFDLHIETFQPFALIDSQERIRIKLTLENEKITEMSIE